jgi:hypothetical protein
VCARARGPLDELGHLADRAQVELDALVASLDLHGAAYADTYARWLARHPARGKAGPPEPPELHPKAAALVREIVLDETASRRLSGSRRSASVPTTQSTAGGGSYARRP